MQEAGMPTPSRVRGVFEDVLASGDFTVIGESPLALLYRLIQEFLTDLFIRFWPEVGEATAFWTFWGAFAVLVCLGALVLYRRYAGRGVRKATRPTAGMTGPRDSAGWVRWARREAAEGRVREAATGLYQAVILHLERSGQVRYREWKTPGDYALEIDPDEPIRADFRSFLSHFLHIAFGPSEPTSESLDALFMRADRLGCR